MNNNVFAYFSNGYRLFSSYWWMRYLKPKTWYRPFVWAYQRVVRGWADCDTWNFEGYICEIVPPALEYLRDKGNGYPVTMTNDEWSAILTKIAAGFRGYSSYRYDDNKEAGEKFQEAMSLFVQHFESFWD